jgi:hypothetical protein
MSARGAVVALICRAIHFAESPEARDASAGYETTIPPLRTLLADVQSGAIDAASFAIDPDTTSPWFAVMCWAEEDLGRDMWTCDTENAA